MDTEKKARGGGGRAGAALFFALLACLLIAGIALFQRYDARQIADSGDPETLLAQLEADSQWVDDAVSDQLGWLSGVAARMTAQPDEAGMRALLPEVTGEREALRSLCLLAADGTGFAEDGAPVSFAGEFIVCNALNSPLQQAADYFEAYDGAPAVLTAVSFADAEGDARVLLAAQALASLTPGSRDGRFAVVTQRGDIIAQSGPILFPETTANLLDYLATPGILGTPKSAMYQAFLDLDRGVSMHRIEGRWYCLLYAPVDGTNWMAALAVPVNTLGIDGEESLEKLLTLVATVAGGGAALSAVLLCIVLARRASKRRRMHAQRELLLNHQDD